MWASPCRSSTPWPLRHFREDAALQIHRDEQGRLREQLRTAQEQVAGAHAVAVQGEMKAFEDFRLRLGVEIHERIAADEQIQARDRRILHEVVAPEAPDVADPGPELEDPHPAARPATPQIATMTNRLIAGEDAGRALNVS